MAGPQCAKSLQWNSVKSMTCQWKGASRCISAILIQEAVPNHFLVEIGNPPKQRNLYWYVSLHTAKKKNKLELWRTLCAFSPFLKGGLFMFVCVFSRQVLDFLLVFLVLSFPVSLIFCFPCFSACCFPCFSAFLLFAFLLLCFSASLFSLLLCFCTYVPFYFYYSTFFSAMCFLLLYFLLLCFFASCLYCLFVFDFLLL